MLLKDRVALVTGGSRGIGRAIAEVFLREGAVVAICGRKKDALDAAALEMGVRAIPIPCHVGRPEEVERLVEMVHNRFGRVDVLVNNAATNVARGPALSIDDGQFDKMIDVNLKSAFRLIRLIAPGMCDRGLGSIINIAAISGLKPQFEGMMYSATKAALIMMTQSYALELGPMGVRVNAIAPGLIRTDLSAYYWKDETRLQKFIGSQAIKQIGEPADVAEVALLLANERSGYMTGQTIVVDGGASLRTI